MSLVPLLIIPFILFNLIASGLLGISASTTTDVWDNVIMNVPMLTGASWQMTLGDLMILIGLVLFFFEILKSTRVGSASIIDHMLSTFLFIAFLVEFLLVQYAAHTVFFTLMLIALIDVLAGFSVSIRSASRDVNFGG